MGSTMQPMASASTELPHKCWNMHISEEHKVCFKIRPQRERSSNIPNSKWHKIRWNQEFCQCQIHREHWGCLENFRIFNSWTFSKCCLTGRPSSKWTESWLYRGKCTWCSKKRPQKNYSNSIFSALSRGHVCFQFFCTLDLPRFYTWDTSSKTWKIRKRGEKIEGHDIHEAETIGRVYTVSPRQGECFFSQDFTTYNKRSNVFWRT